MSVEIRELALVLGFAAGFGIIAKWLRQPMILAYLAAGAVLAWLGYLPGPTTAAYQGFAEFGIMFLLFMVGMEIRYTSLRLVGFVSLMIGLGQIVVTFGVGFILAMLLNLDLLTAAYIAAALTFSSTIIVVKLLSEKKDLNSLYGKISLGLLLVQDMFAILLLVTLPGLRSGHVDVTGLSVTVVKAVGLFVVTIWLGRRVIPTIFDQIAHSPELLFLASVAWVFIIAAVVAALGLSIEIGGFLAGLALANSSEQFHIIGRIRPLRDFFISLFFVTLGTSLAMSSLHGLITPIIVFSLYVLVGNPLIVMIIMNIMGYHHRTSFLTGITIAQISEFSLILAALGLRLGHIDSAAVTIISAVGVITIILSSYMIQHGERLYRWSQPLLTALFGESAVRLPRGSAGQIRKPIIMFGAHRTGQSILPHLQKRDVLVVDFDPDVIAQLRKNKFQAMFGDLADQDLMHHINLRAAKLIVSTSPDLEDNLTLIATIRAMRRPGQPPRVVVRAETEREAKMLYERGADYVLVPHLTSGHSIGRIIAHRTDSALWDSLKRRDLALMNHPI